MKRRLFNVVAGLSLILGIAACVTWAKSYSNWGSADYSFVRYDQADVTDLDYCIGYGTGGAFVDQETHKRDDVDVTEWKTYVTPGAWSFESGPITPGHLAYDPVGTRFFHGLGDWRFHDFGIYRYRRQGSEFRVIQFPLWLLALLLMLSPTILAFRRAQSIHRRIGFCSACGYDLRATPNRCPECGTAAKTEPGSGDSGCN